VRFSEWADPSALLFQDGRWCLPRGGMPTTHIFKLPLGLIGGMKSDLRDSVENEWLCSLVLQAHGLPVAASRPLQFEDMKALVVERFDRAWWPARPTRPERLQPHSGSSRGVEEAPNLRRHVWRALQPLDDIRETFLIEQGFPRELTRGDLGLQRRS
jgi:serine/threonine-protein kinase HipA